MKKIIKFMLFLGLNVGVANAQTVYLAEHFDYPADSLLQKNGWYGHSAATTNPIKVTNGGLSWTKSNYKGSGVGNAAAVNNTGADENKPFASDATTGNLYVSFLMTVNKMTATSGGVFFHLGQYSNPTTPVYTALSTSFRARTHIAAGADSTKFKLGLSFNNSSADATTADLNVGETYLVVVKQIFVSGASNDSVALYVFADGDDISKEPAKPTLGPMAGTQSDLTSIQAVVLRQYSSTQNVTVDGIIAQDNWDIVKATQAPKYTRTVKFSVDMSSETVSANGVHVAGNFQGWSPSGTTLKQEGSTGIYSVYAEVDTTSVVEYKFINNNDWSSGVESVPAINQKGHKNNGESNDNRWFWSGTGKDTLVLPAFKFSGSAPSGQSAVRIAVDLKAEASVSADGVHIAGNLQGWNPGKDRMVNLYSSNKIHEIIFCLADGSYEYKFVNGNAWGKDESVPSACATNNNRGLTVSGGNVEAKLICYGSCDACPGKPSPKYRVTFQVDMGAECNVDDVDLAGGKINGWAGGTYLSNQSGLSGDWKITKIGVGPSKGDIGWFSESITSTTRACMQDDRVVFNRDGSFHNVMGKETWIEGWQKTGANGCGTPVAPFDGSTAGTWKDHGNGTFTVYGKGSHVGIPKVVNGAEISSNADARDSVTYEYSITGNKLTTYINFGGGYWQFEYDRNATKSSVWTTTIVLDSGVEVAHKFRKITKANGSDIVSWEGGSDRKIFAHNDTTLLARCFGKDEACAGTPIPPADVTFKVDMSQEIAADTVWLMGSMTIPAWQSGAIALKPSATEKDVYETTVKGICPDYFEYKFANEVMNSQTNGETYPDTTDRSCLVDNGLGAFNRKLTRTNGDAITVFYMYNSCMMGGNSSVSDLSAEVSIAPVPAVESFTVRLAGSTATQVSIMSIDGRLVRSMSANSSVVEMNCSGLNGVYLVSVVDQMGRTAVKKIVIGQ